VNRDFHVVDQLLGINDSDYLVVLSKMIDDSHLEEPTVVLTEGQKLMLTMAMPILRKEERLINTYLMNANSMAQRFGYRSGKHSSIKNENRYNIVHPSAPRACEGRFHLSCGAVLSISSLHGLTPVPTEISPRWGFLFS
jgi:hypothetical protein